MATKLFNSALILLLGCMFGSAHGQGDSVVILSAGYSDHGRISADIDEGEVEPDKYAEYDLEVERARSLRFVVPEYHFYARYTGMDAVDDKRHRYTNRFRSHSALPTRQKRI